MKNMKARLYLSAILTTVALYCASCSFVYTVRMTGYILGFQLLGVTDLRMTFENHFLYNNSDKPKSIEIHTDGSFIIADTFYNVLPQTLSLWQKNQVIARLVINDHGHSVSLIDPLTGTNQQYTRTWLGNHLEISGLQIQPTFDSTNLAILNVDKLLDRLQYSEGELVFHFSAIPPTGSKLYLFGGMSGVNFTDTTIQIADTTVQVHSSFFWDYNKKRNIFVGGHFSNPYGWFRPFNINDFPGYPDIRNSRPINPGE